MYVCVTQCILYTCRRQPTKNCPYARSENIGACRVKTPLTSNLGTTRNWRVRFVRRSFFLSRVKSAFGTDWTVNRVGTTADLSVFWENSRSRKEPNSKSSAVHLVPQSRVWLPGVDNEEVLAHKGLLHHCGKICYCVLGSTLARGGGIKEQPNQDCGVGTQNFRHRLLNFQNSDSDPVIKPQYVLIMVNL
jgi:hypothetical protein